MSPRWRNFSKPASLLHPRRPPVSAIVSDHRAVTLVVPCYNEALRLDAQALLAAVQRDDWLSLLLVDDGSSDATPDILHALARAHPGRITVLALEANRGKAEAVRQGLLRAMESAPVVGFWDADLSAPLDEVPLLRATLSAREDVEWVWGIRLRSLGRVVERSARRHYAGRVFATLVDLVLGWRAYDTQCGAKLFRRSELLRSILSEPFVSRWIFDVELLSRAGALRRAAGRPDLDSLVHEQPLREWRHRDGSKVRASDAVKAAVELFRIKRAERAWATRRVSTTGDQGAATSPLPASVTQDAVAL
jgi:dolichyl-phosphate beta-glucosyltransferase